MNIPHVYFSCDTCGWRHDVPRKHVVLAKSGIPTSVYVPYHQCEGGADVREHGCFDAELRTEKPGYWMRLKL